MIFRVRPEHYDEAIRRNWFEFPTFENIKWFWVTLLDSWRMLDCASEEQRGTQGRKTLPFYKTEDGRVVWNVKESAFQGPSVNTCNFLVQH